LRQPHTFLLVLIASCLYHLNTPHKAESVQLLTGDIFPYTTGTRNSPLRHCVQAGSGASCMKGDGVFSTRAKEAEDSLGY